MYLRLTMLFVFLCIGLLAISTAYTNVAFNKPTYQEYPYRPDYDQYDASNAVDGRKTHLYFIHGSDCAVSYLNQTATWWVNLTNIYSIHHITIYFRTDLHGSFDQDLAGFYLGFSVYVSNTTNISEGTLCFKDTAFTMHTIPSVFTTNCFVHGQYVIFYNERLPGVVYPAVYENFVFSDLCEVEVYGCPATWFYGPNCSIPCPDANCQYCHIETGTCQSCKPGYQGHRCELACNKDFFGVDCNEECGHCREIYQCHHIHGTCINGCAAGYHGNMCKSRCDKGSYGLKCKETCGQCLDVNQCSNVNGTCLTGCDAGFDGEICKTQCDRGFYGIECNETCGHCRDVNQCYNVNGTCLTGCDAGFKGDLCKTQCDKGSFGIGCNETCGQCRDVNQCSNTNGTCLTGCEAGFKGDLCKTGCDSRSYGVGCNEICGNCLNDSQCSNINGTCFTGCNAGYEGDVCKTQCDRGSYGYECNQTCGHCIGVRHCFPINGTCLTGCDFGYEGDLCKTRE